jgi:hypothetical protein
MKEYSTMITSKYIPSWTVANGVREYVANALDSIASFEYCFGDDYIEITSKNVILPATIFALGYSKNRDNINAVGTHGEGCVVAMVPLLREGKTLVFHNGPKMWEPYFRYDEDLELSLLTIKETELVQETKDFTVTIGNLTSSELEEVKHDCLYLQGDIGEVKEGKNGRVLSDIKGKLYVGGLFVKNLPNHKYSYDFKPSALTLNRDRKTVEGWDLARNTSQLLEEVFPAKEVAQLLFDRASDVDNLQYAVHNEEVSNSCYELFKEQHGAGMVVTSYADQTILESKGYKNVVVIGDDNLATMIKRSEEYEKYVEEVENCLESPCEEDKTPVELIMDFEKYLEEHERVDNKTVELLQDIIKQFDTRGVKWDD